MFKFFRSIRRRLLQNAKFSKYLIYAIGEIALVMVGILLALQVNNWNERQNRKKIEISTLSEMRENLENDLRDIRGNISFDSTNHLATLEVLQHLESKQPFNDALKDSYGKLGWASLFAENTSAFENLKTLGFNLIANEELRGAITFLYSTRYEYLNEVLNRYNDTVFDHFRPQMIQYTSSETGKFFTRQPNDYKKLAENQQFQELLREDLFTKEFCINLNRKVSGEVELLIQLIDKELLK